MNVIKHYNLCWQRFPIAKSLLHSILGNMEPSPNTKLIDHIWATTHCSRRSLRRINLRIWSKEISQVCVLFTAIFAMQNRVVSNIVCTCEYDENSVNRIKISHFSNQNVGKQINKYLTYLHSISKIYASWKNEYLTGIISRRVMLYPRTFSKSHIKIHLYVDLYDVFFSFRNNGLVENRF